MVTLLLPLHIEPVNTHRFDLAVVPKHRARPQGLDGD